MVIEVLDTSITISAVFRVVLYIDFADLTVVADNILVGLLGEFLEGFGSGVGKSAFYC